MLRGAKSTSTSSEGTTIAMEGEGDTPLCGVCEEHKATKFCESCSDALCNSCAKSHAKYVGPSHVLREIAYGSRHSSISRSESVGEVAKICACGRHPSYQVSRVCKPCKIVLCEKCVEEELHKDHDVVAFQDDRDFMAEVCNNRVKSLSDNIDNVGKLSYVSDASEESIDAAILQLKHKHAEMAQTMNTCVLKNISILEKEKQRIRKDAEYVKEEAENNISKMKSRMSGLDSVCKTQDLNAMVDEITLCDHVMDEVDQFMREYRQTIPKVHRVEDLLPGLKLSDNLNKTMDQVFEVVLPGKSTQESGVEIEGGTPGVAQKNKFEYQKVEINRCVEMKECYVGKMVQGSKLQQHMNQVVMYRNGEREVYIVNYNEASLKYVKAGFNIDNCLTVSSDRHVAKEHRSQNLHLLDNNFKKVMSHRRRMKYKPSLEGKCIAPATPEVKCTEGDIGGKFNYRQLRIRNSTALNKIGSRQNKCIKSKKKDIIRTGMSQTAHGISSFEHIVMFEVTGRDVNIVNYKTGEVQGLKADCNIMECLTVSPGRYLVASATRLKSKSYFLQLLNHSLKTIHKIPSPRDRAAMCCLEENEFLVYSHQDHTLYDVFYTYQIIDDKIKLTDTVQVTGLPDPDMINEIRLGMHYNPSKGNVIILYKSYSDEDKWFQCYTVNLHSGSVTKYTGDEPVCCQYIDCNGDLLVCTDDDVLRVYRDAGRGIGDYEELTHVNVDEYMVGIVRHGDSLVLGYKDRVDYYALR